jgi:hypothetical protein
VNKDEVLEKSRKENKDERDEIVRDKSMRWTLIMMVTLSAIFAFIRANNGDSIMDLTVVVCGSVFVSFTYRYLKTKRSELLIMGIISACVAIVALVRFCMGY